MNWEQEISLEPENLEQEINLESENPEQEINLESENVSVIGGDNYYDASWLFEVETASQQQYDRLLHAMVVKKRIVLASEQEVYNAIAYLDNNNNIAIVINNDGIESYDNTSYADNVVTYFIVDKNTKAVSSQVGETNGATFAAQINELSSSIESKQDKIDSSHKLASDLVDDTNQTNQFVTIIDKTNWDAKYDKPSAGIPKTDLTSTVQTSLEKADTAVQPSDLSIVATSGSYNDLTNKPDLSNFATKTELGNETTARENADIGLQGQIDAITSSSDVKDIVGTYTELQNYDTSTLGNDDIIKVLQDSTHNEAMTYYRWVITGGTGSWQYIGQEGPYYTKSESDTLLNAKQNEITSSNKLTSDLVSDTNQTNKFVTASDITTWNNKADISDIPIDFYGKGTIIPDNSDLDNYTTIGKYYVNSGSSALSLTNCPTTTNFVLYVIKRTDYVSQIIVDLNGKIYTRSASSSGLPENWTTGVVDANYVHTDNNFTNADVTKLSGIEAGAEVNVQANWNETSSSSDAYIQNKPYIPKYYYGTCSTKNSTRAKVVVCPDFVLEEEATISVLFTAAQTYNGAPTLNVNGTGAITVQYKSGTSGIRYMWSAGEIIDFTYNGTYWVCHGRALATTTYYGIAKYSESLVSTSASYALTPSAINTAMIKIISGTPVYSSSATYDVGDKVRYTDNVWRCTTAIETAEAWNAEHWEVVSPLQNQIDLKQDTLVSGTNIKTINNTSLLGSGNIDIQGGGTTDYSDLTNKPSINNVTLSGNKSLSDLGIQPSGSYATTTDLATKQDITDNSLTTTNKTIPSAINEVNSIAKGANQAVGYSNYSSMITAINAMDDDEFSMGQNIYVVTVNVPDLWVSSVESTSSTYTYVDDATIVSALQTNGYIQVGYYKLSMLETQKVDLTGYQTKIDSSHKLSADLVDDANTTNKFVTSTDITNWNNKGTYSKPSGGIPSTDLDSAVQTSLGKADTAIQSLDSCVSKDSGSAVQMVSLTSGTGTTALGVKSMSPASSYMSFSNTGGWLGSYGVSSSRNPVFYNGVGYTLATTDDLPKLVTLSQSDYDDLVDGGTVDADTYYFIEE